jgi:hypothetical protein
MSDMSMADILIHLRLRLLLIKYPSRLGLLRCFNLESCQDWRHWRSKIMGRAGVHLQAATRSVLSENEIGIVMKILTPATAQ